MDTLNLKQCEDIRLKRVAGRRIDDSANAVLFRCSFDNLKNIYHPESPWLEGPFDPEPSSRATAVPAGRIRTFGDRATVRWELPGFSTDAIRKRDEWWAPIPVSSFLEYGTTPEMTQRAYSTGELFHRVNLYGLTSGKDYYARIVIPEEPLLYENGIGIRKVNGNVARGEIFRFTVPPYSAAHRKLFVAQNGSDAADGSGNVGFYSRQLEYTDYRTPVFSLSAPLRFPVGTSFNICSGISAESSLDGNLSDNIKYTLDRTVSSSAPGTYQIEFRVTDSAEKTSYLQTELEVYDPGEEQLEVTLTAYLVYLNVNDSFHASDYFQESETGGEPEIESNVDTSKAGTYYVDYTVTEDGFTGKSRLIVVVR